MTVTNAWGEADEPAEVVRLGAWSLERRGDEIADVRFEGSVVLRSIRAVVRDRDWATVPCRVVRAEASEHGLVLELRFVGRGADLAGRLETAGSGSRLTVRLDLESHAAFERNRAGLVVLHPARLAGTVLDVGHPGGLVERTRFPERIAPHQPARTIRTLGWSSDGVTSHLHFAGDVFEMEDQRNWTDASFKTYSTPLDLPFPVLLAEGDRIEQSLLLECRRTAPATMAAARDEITLTPTAARFPAVMLGASTGPEDIEEGQVAAGGVLVELPIDQPVWRPALDRAIAEAAGAPLDVRLIARDPAEVAPVVRELAARVTSGLRVDRVGVFSATSHLTEPELWHALRAALEEDRLQVDLVGGTRAHFTELNRGQQRLPADLPSVTFSSTPQMHARETAQLIESLVAERETVLAASAIAGGRPIHVGPVTLRPRFNAVATSGGPAPVHDLSRGYGAALEEDTDDPRQGSAGVAAWVVASAAAFAVPSVATITYFEASGPRGLGSRDHPAPAARSIELLHRLAGHPMLEASASSPGVHALAVETDSGAEVLVAHLGTGPRTVRIRMGERYRDVRLEPVSITRVELERDERDQRTSASTQS